MCEIFLSQKQRLPIYFILSCLSFYLGIRHVLTNMKIFTNLNKPWLPNHNEKMEQLQCCPYVFHNTSNWNTALLELWNQLLKPSLFPRHLPKLPIALNSVDYSSSSPPEIYFNPFTSHSFHSGWLTFWPLRSFTVYHHSLSSE